MSVVPRRAFSTGFPGVSKLKSFTVTKATSPGPPSISTFTNIFTNQTPENPICGLPNITKASQSSDFHMANSTCSVTIRRSFAHRAAGCLHGVTKFPKAHGGFNDLLLKQLLLGTKVGTKWHQAPKHPNKNRFNVTKFMSLSLAENWLSGGLRHAFLFYSPVVPIGWLWCIKIRMHTLDGPYSGFLAPGSRSRCKSSPCTRSHRSQGKGDTSVVWWPSSVLNHLPRRPSCHNPRAGKSFFAKQLQDGIGWEPIDWRLKFNVFFQLFMVDIGWGVGKLESHYH